jgi:Alkyl sulfatase C-terminal/Alkyl sulfatase dimerisation
VDCPSVRLLRAGPGREPRLRVTSGGTWLHGCQLAVGSVLPGHGAFWLVCGGAPGRIRTCAHGTGGRHWHLSSTRHGPATIRPQEGYGPHTWPVYHLVFSDPGNTEAKNLQADAYEQLGYQQEIPQWRGIFLTAAMELRQGFHTEDAFSSVSPDTILNMPTELLFDFAAVHVVGERAADVDVRINVTVTGGEKDEQWTMWIANGVLNARPAHADDVQATVTGTMPAVVGLLRAAASGRQIVGSVTPGEQGDHACDGDGSGEHRGADPGRGGQCAAADGAQYF